MTNEINISNWNDDGLLRDIQYLDKIKYQIAELQKKKEKLDLKVKEKFKHYMEGARTYEIDVYKVTVTTNKNYSVNKSEYEAAKGLLNASLNPVKEQIKYSVSSKDYHTSFNYASQAERDILSTFITTKDSKLNVSIKAND